ncbi:MAG: hypothetical protein PHI12_07860 [Dehalococcoidales bacterium]|jgi:hypothetical protein|nr:hypothetical protein [Dehalococcoidales bacterium]
MVLIAFEGPSGVGKSTLISLVAERTGIPAITRDPVVRKFRVTAGHHDIFVLEQMSILNKVPFDRIDMLIDRMPVVSQWAYDELLCRTGEVPRRDWAMVPKDTAFVWLERDWEDKHKQEQQKEYDRLVDYASTHYPILRIKTDQYSIYQCVKAICDWIPSVINDVKH